ncbi:MAG: SiaB family protein kinase [Bacteroidota bacterium]
MNYQVLYKNLYDPSILLLHKGNISFELISLILESLEASVSGIEEDKKIRKKFNNIITESFQNISFHGQKRSDDQSNTDLLMVLSRKYFYKIVTGNLVSTSQVPALTEQLERINQMNKDELRQYYKEVMSNEQFSESGTAGLGFIDMARKTGQKLVYKFLKMDEQYTYFTFQVKIKKNQQSKKVTA